jgi:hypothetical protein
MVSDDLRQRRLEVIREHMDTGPPAPRFPISGTTTSATTSPMTR